MIEIAVAVVETEIVTSVKPVAEIAGAIEIVVIEDNKDDRSRMLSPLHRTIVATSGRKTVNVADVRTVAETSHVAKTVVAMRVADVIAKSAVRATSSAPPHLYPLKAPHRLRA